MTAIIETEGLRRSFRTRQGDIEAVAGVDLRVAAGELFGFLGPNGAGKTTTLRMLTTLLTPSGGRARVAGHDLMSAPNAVRARIGYVGQAGGVDNSATVRENIVLQARLFGLGRAQAEKRTAELAAALELDSILGQLGRTLSGGQRRRVDLALGMVHSPDVLFLDEPTAGLDPQSRTRLWSEVRRLRQEGTTVFLTTHYLEEADELCDRLAIIDGGKIVAEGTPTALKRRIAGDLVVIGFVAGEHCPRAEALLGQQPFVREVKRDDKQLRLYVDDGEQALPAILRVMDGAGVPLGTLALARPSLDDVFLRQTGRSLRETAN